MRAYLTALALIAALAIPYVAGCGSVNSTPATTTTTTLPASWQAVGGAGFTGTTEVNESFIALDASGTPYAAFSDGLPAPLPAVMSYTGGSWALAGQRGLDGVAGSSYSAGSLSLAFYNSAPYAACNAANRLPAARLNGATWEAAGFPSTANDSYPALFGDASGLYCVFQSNTTLKANLVKYQGGTTWGPLTAAKNFSAGEARYLSLCVDSGTPYVAYADHAYGGRLTVARYNTGADSMTFLGSEGGASSTEVVWPSLFVSGGTPYVAFFNSGESAVIVEQWNGAAWTAVGSAAASASGAGFPSLYVHNGVPYVAFADAGAANEATVLKYTGSWETVGQRGFSADPLDSAAERRIALTFSPAGIPYVVVRGKLSGGSRLAVYKFN
ncbi:MAG: hypothetical protein JW873_06645 [Candidatus Saganbacteria bacterium]|nr:hypothetical protein [Candidatus Saganbacteria bacterium]